MNYDIGRNITAWLLKNDYAIALKDTTVTNITLAQDEISVSELGLKHGVLLRPKEPEMVAIVENIWEQIEKQYIKRQSH